MDSEKIERACRLLLEGIGEDPTREGLRDTPRRVVAAWGERTAGYGADIAALLKTDFDAEGYDEMIVCRDIAFYSTCEHHLLPFSGVAHVGYLPEKRVVGLSKMARLVEAFATRLQVQERLTQQVAQAMQQHVHPSGVGVIIRAKHLCMACRGVKKPEADMVTSALTGSFRQAAVRAEFLALTRNGGG